MSIENWELCEGCDCYDKDNKIDRCDARIEPSFNDCLCPCINCLIKMCCTHSCKEFEKYTDNFSIKIWRED
jgi:hypothetical protein